MHCLFQVLIAVIGAIIGFGLHWLWARWCRRPNLRVLAGRMGGCLAKDGATQREIWLTDVTVEIRNNSAGTDFVERIELELEAVNGRPRRTSHQRVVESPAGWAAVGIKSKWSPVFPWSERLQWELPILEKPGRARGKVAFAVSLSQFPELRPSSPSDQGFPWRVMVFGRDKRVWATPWYGNKYGDPALT